MTREPELKIILDMEENIESLKGKIRFLQQERDNLRAMVIRRDRAIQLIHNHTYDPNCPCAVCSMYAAEGWEVI